MTLAASRDAVGGAAWHGRVVVRAAAAEREAQVLLRWSLQRGFAPLQWALADTLTVLPAEGGVVVVGTAQSGSQIALELCEAGRSVYLCQRCSCNCFKASTSWSSACP